MYNPFDILLYLAEKKFRPFWFETGYLTIRDYKEMLDGVIYSLTYPNKEVEISLNRNVLYYITKNGMRVTNSSYRISIHQR